VICPECGQDVTASKSTPRIRDPELEDCERRQEIDELLTHGWLCSQHQYDVVFKSS
jgi:transcription initiation factor IIE alpha subunit